MEDHRSRERASPIRSLCRANGRYGHLNFQALRELGVKGMVDGIPLLDRVEEVCDGCALGKHQRHPFPQVASYRAEKGLDLVHADLCGQIRPKTQVVRAISC